MAATSTLFTGSGTASMAAVVPLLLLRFLFCRCFFRFLLLNVRLLTKLGSSALWLPQLLLASACCSCCFSAGMLGPAVLVLMSDGLETVSAATRLATSSGSRLRTCSRGRSGSGSLVEDPVLPESFDDVATFSSPQELSSLLPSYMKHSVS